MMTPGAFEDRRSLHARLMGLRIAGIAAFGVIAIGFWTIQVVRYQKYSDMAENQHLRTIPLRAPRGMLYDRNGRVLVENRASFTIALSRETTRNLDGAIRRLAAVTGADEARIRDVVQRHRGEAIFRPIPVIEHATLEQVAAVLTRRLELPEVVVQQVPMRTYPEDDLAAHLFGYVGEIQDTQIDRPEFAGLQPGAVVGQTGLERVYNSELQGTDGNRYVIVNNVGREIEEQGQDDPVDGSRMQLTIDLDLQQALEDGFRARDYAGAAAILDPRTGEVLAMTSLPAYDPNDFAAGIDRATWNQLNTDPLRPMIDRLVQGTYPPGSTFKIVVALAALSAGVITPDTRFYCPGYLDLYGRRLQCSRAGGHGWVDVRHAIEQSCNVFFYNIGKQIDVDTIHKYAGQLGLTGKTGIDLPGEVASLVPSSDWKRRTTGEPWYPGETISVAIGQGQVSVTPISLATMISTVANGGTVVTPHVLKAEDDGEGWVPVPAPAPRSFAPLPPDVLAPIRDGLWLAVNGAGTAGRARIAGRDVVGKTGTAQVISLSGARAAAGRTSADLRDDGWFVFFAPRDHPQIAGVVFVEHGEHGGSAAAPIARHVLETFFAKQDGQPLPPPPVRDK